MTKERDIMYKHALAKWDWIENNWDHVCDYYTNTKRMLADLPELKNYSSYCSFCEKYISSSNAPCPECPLDESGNGCRESNSLYAQWRRYVNPYIRYKRADSNVLAIRRSKKAANKIRNLIQELYKKELRDD